jgi:alginate O-acetyltransferase complex protein AlgJ
MRQDTHWSPGGALLAANTIKSALLASPAHQSALALTLPVRYGLTWKPEHWPRVGDLVGMRGPGAPVLKPESVTGFVVTRGRAGGAGLLGDTPPHGITLLGTSYSAEWTQFPAALRHVLQREVLGISVSALSGQWVGLETYLQDDAFQTRRPGLLIWEMPERDLKSPPDFAGRDPRYVMGNAEWLLRAAAWVQQGCAASPHQLSIEPTGLAKAAATGANASAVRASATHDADFIELRFNPAIDRLDYLSARITSKGSKAWRMEASGPAGTNPRRWTQTVAGDETEHALKMPVAVAAAGQGYTKLKIFPGKTAGFALQAAGLCRQPAALLD